MTCFIKDNRSYTILLDTLRAFGAFSGLKVKDKTKVLALGNRHPEGFRSIFRVKSKG